MLPVYPEFQQIPGLRELWKLSFGDGDAFLNDFFRTGFQKDHCRCLMQGDTAAAALYWFDAEYAGETYAYLYAVATHPEYRHQGLIHYLLADTHQILAARDYAGAMLVPADEGLRQMYTAIGYHDCTTVSQFVSSSLPVDVIMHPIDREEYQRLRRNFLPEGGMIQEGSNLTFLETQGKFYTGPDFLLCCAPKDPDTLVGIEYLGDPNAAPGILCSLGYAHGTFQTPGEKLPHAMLCPLKKDCPEPGYLGLSFE